MRQRFRTSIRLTLRFVLLFGIVLLSACSGQRDGSPQGTEAAAQAMFSESDAYEQFMGRWSRRLATRLVTFATVQSGDSVLDVGSGTGALTEAVLAAAETGRVTGIDPSRAYVDYARNRLKSARASFQEGDAQQLPFAGSEFDRTLALLVINFVPDRAKAVNEMVRVTRTGGTVAAAVWDYGDGMEMLRIFWDEAVALDPSSDGRDERHMPLCRPGELASLWRLSGLVAVEEVPLVIDMPFTSFDDFWSPFLKGQGPAGAYVASLTDARRQMLRDRIRNRLPAGSFTLTARAWAVKGVVPER